MKLSPAITGGGLTASFLVLIMISLAFLTLIANDGAGSSDTVAKVMGSPKVNTLQPGQRQGTHDLAKNPSEYLLTGNQYEYFGAKMLKIDINGDGVEDMAITKPYFYGQSVVIFDGATQVMYPQLKSSSNAAKWKVTWGNDYNNYYFGTDIAVGDVNADGYDDLLIGSAYYYYGQAYLFYGGPQWNNRGTLTLYNADASFIHTYNSNYMGKGVGLGDVDGDGYDDVIACAPGYSAAYIWWGSTSLYGTYYYSTANLRISSSYIGGSGVDTGDMNGDGRDEVAFCTPYSSSSLYLMYPTANIRSASVITAGSTDTYAQWQVFRTPGSYTGCYPALIEDYNGDGLEDLFLGAPAYLTGFVYVVNGRTTFTTGVRNIYQTGVFDLAFYTSEITGSVQYYNAYFGSSTLGDYDGDGKKDLMLGCSNPARAYVILNEVFNGTTGTFDAKNVAVLTIKGEAGSSQFGGPGYYAFYFYYYYPNYGQLQFWDRDGDGLEEMFISDSYCNYNSQYSSGVVFGITPFNMIQPGKTEILSGDLPDGKTYYAEYNYYGIKGSVINRWNPAATEYFHFKFIMGFYSATYAYTPADGMTETDDPLNIMDMDPSRLNITFDYTAMEMKVEFWFKFTLNMSVEFPVQLETYIQVAHINYKSVQDIGRVRHNFLYIGEMKAYLYDAEANERLQELSLGDWIAEDQMIEFSGPKLVYNGTENFVKDHGVEPFYPPNRVFKIMGSSTLYEEAFDDNSSGRGFSMIMRGGDLPLLMEYKFEQVGIPTAKILNSIPGFYMNVDVDTPSVPAGVRIHADSFDDSNTIVDNDGELYITWGVPAEYNSGIDHYEVTVTGIEDPIETVDNFVKVTTEAVGDIVATIRAFDRVGHVGLPGSGSIRIEKEGVSFTNGVPGPEEWFNTYAPVVGYTITDDGGRFVIGSTVEYAVSMDGGATWGPWTNAGNTLSAPTLVVTVSPVLIEGSTNQVKFRAQDEAGNVGESEPVQVNVDVSGLEFTDVKIDGSSEWSGKWIADGEAEVTFTVIDALSGVDISTLQYRYTTRSRSDLELTAWTGQGVVVGAEGKVTLPRIVFAMGDRNYVQFRGQDQAGNPWTYSKAYNVWVNTLPVSVMSSPEDGLEVLEGTLVRFDGTLSRDTDGDVLTYTFLDDGEVVGAGSTDPARFDLELGVGVHNISLKVSDGIHEVVSGTVKVVVIDRVVPIWLTGADEDGDGLPNYYEYIYHLGWNDAGNKDSTYLASMAGLDKGKIWDDIGKEYIGGKVAVTSENDFDGDGHTDFEEYLQGTNPTDVTDFPVYKGTGEKGEDAVDTLLIVLVVLAIVVIVAVIMVLALNSMAIRKKLTEEAAQAAQEEEVRVQRLLEGGGSQRLAALKAASEGKAVLTLPSPVVAQAALPMGEPVPVAGMVAQPVTAAAPVGWVAAPAAAADPGQQGQYANINSGSNVPPM